MNREINIHEKNVFYSEVKCQLGEGIYYDETTERLLWLDITESTLFVSGLECPLNVTSFQLSLNPSTIFKVEWPNVYISDSKGILNFNCISLESNRVLNLHLDSSRGLDMRTNDGVMIKDKYFFGSMAKTPKENEGQLFLYDEKKEHLSFSNFHISIPNTFIELENCVLISDSFEQKIYKYSKNNLLVERQEWHDFSKSAMTPDGGCKSPNGVIYITMWGGGCVKSFDQNGNELCEFILPVPQPTNCVLIEGSLYITTAREGLSLEQLKKYPLSGAIFKIDLGETSEQVIG
ncbi:hypothetical protein DS891_16820 [Pseudoalteromonas sp. JC28]|uniref:SMP-30/gluconolactonase/LRE family protein n=1 Tax=Pseudoalteromonas sp. JC28 TaxID=2267617 RepID=UPI001572BA8F|nr:SMP-30/gluconolactonase/LRE family protein [Pseudoalteromonas sp. JC28]NSY35204.1 hypothetical protein [Pseudoalteromonas sp. JC28]